MAISAEAKKMWIENQKKHDHPVNAIGLKINSKDAMMLKIWKEEGLDAYVKK